MGFDGIENGLKIGDIVIDWAGPRNDIITFDYLYAGEMTDSRQTNITSTGDRAQQYQAYCKPYLQW